ncbi:putative uncharacterized protein [Tannerella sp. CAG:118]|uniref:OmpA-like domain-containing protein n=2 Tax=Bacteroidia TaxID=200643 RepID=A0A7G1HX29_9BACT|nr:hypothetical protein Cop2CBH44_05100 [Coprobacter secundus subsp. similis]CCY36245.1 putative uncharacterized protein [Tannerella sp. CAG:118]
MIKRKIILSFSLIGCIYLFPMTSVFSQDNTPITVVKSEKIPFWKKIFWWNKKDTVYVHPNIQNFTLEGNCMVPAISAKALPQIRKTVLQEMRRLYKIKQIKVSTVRNGEVIKVVIPMSQLFQPNDTTLWNRANLMLRPFIRYTQIPDYYHILIVAHSDDTGTQAYTENLTRIRAEAVKEWLLAYGAVPEYVVTYAQGSKNPLYSNTSEVNRDRNRRLEIYLVPGEELIWDAEKNKINFKE